MAIKGLHAWISFNLPYRIDFNIKVISFLVTKRNLLYINIYISIDHTVGRTPTKVKFENKYIVKMDEIQDERFGSSLCGPLSEVLRFGGNLRLSYLGQRI